MTSSIRYSTLVLLVFAPFFAAFGQPAGTHALQGYDRTSVFTENHGQWPSEVQYLARLNGLDAWITGDGMILDLRVQEPRMESDPETKSRTGPPVHEPSRYRRHVLRMRVEGAAPGVVRGRYPIPGYHNYLAGTNPSRWARFVPRFAEVVTEIPATGISMRTYIDRGHLRYDLQLAPGADPAALRLRIEGADDMRIDDGRLVLATSLGDVIQSDLYAYQGAGKTQRTITCRFVELGDDTIEFDLDDYDPTQPLVIDPLIFAAFLSGTDDDHARDIALDGDGYLYTTGETRSEDFPVTPGAFDETADDFVSSDMDVFVAKMSATDGALVYATYISGFTYDRGYGIAVDAEGHAYITGETSSAVDLSSVTPDMRFPLTVGAYDTSPNGYDEAFVLKLDPTGAALVYSTLLGSSHDDHGSDIALDAQGNAYVTGWTFEDDFPVTPGAPDLDGGPFHSFASKLSTDGSALLYSTYLSGSDTDYATSIAVDDEGNAYVTGETRSPDFPITPGAFDEQHDGLIDAFVTKINPTGTAFIYSTFLGGTANESAFGIHVDTRQTPYVVGSTRSRNFPVTPGTFDADPSRLVGYGVFISQLDASGATLLTSTLLDGVSDDSGRDIFLDEQRNVYVAGRTWSRDFPITPGAIQTVRDESSRDAFVSKLDPTLSVLIYSTFLGGNDEDVIRRIVADNQGNAYIAGATESSDFPATSGVFQGGVEDAFVARIQTPPCLEVWPGDTDSNGLVDQNDVLPIGLYWHTHGAARADRSMAWTGQCTGAWSPPNAAFADAFGDGFVDEAEILPIGVNFGKTRTSTTPAGHLKNRAVSGNARLYLDAHLEQHTYRVDVRGETSTGLFGAAFVVEAEGPVDAVSAEAGDWLGADVVFFAQVQQASAQIGISRKAGQDAVIGSGTLARLFFQRRTGEPEAVTLRLLEPNAVDQNGETLTVTTDGALTLTAIETGRVSGHPVIHTLYPNPFSGSATFRYEVFKPGRVVLDVYDLLGRTVRRLHDGMTLPGLHTVTWNGRDASDRPVPSGVYLFRLHNSAFTAVHRSLLIR